MKKNGKGKQIFLNNRRMRNQHIEAHEHFFSYIDAPDTTVCQSIRDVSLFLSTGWQKFLLLLINAAKFMGFAGNILKHAKCALPIRSNCSAVDSAITICEVSQR